MAVNWLAVAAQASSSFMLGGHCYGLASENAWMKAAAVTPQQVKGADKTVMFGATFVRALMRALALALAASAMLVSSAAASDGPLAQMDFLQGCWRGAFQSESGVSDIRCFQPMLGGRYLRDTHVVHNGAAPYSGETIYYLDAQTQLLSFVYFASDGGVMRGTGTVDAQGVTFPPSQYLGSDGQPLILRSSWRRDGADRFVAVTEIQDRDQWRPLHAIIYVRALELSPPAQ